MRPSRITTGEYIDAPADAAQLAASFDHVAAVNRWLGGTRALLRALRPLLDANGCASFLDVGTGSADIPRVIVADALRHGRRAHIVATDLHPQTVAIARSRTRGFDTIHVVRASALRLPFPDRSFDFALLSLTLHHLDDDAQPLALRELARVARRAILVNELERSWPNYFGARLLAETIWRENPLTRHDAPVSVRRAFTVGELLARARSAGLSNARVERSFFYRLVLIADA